MATLPCAARDSDIISVSFLLPDTGEQVGVFFQLFDQKIKYGFDTGALVHIGMGRDPCLERKVEMLGQQAFQFWFAIGEVTSAYTQAYSFGDRRHYSSDAGGTMDDSVLAE